MVVEICLLDRSSLATFDRTYPAARDLPFPVNYVAGVPTDGASFVHTLRWRGKRKAARCRHLIFLRTRASFS